MGQKGNTRHQYAAVRSGVLYIPDPAYTEQQQVQRVIIKYLNVIHLDHPVLACAITGYLTTPRTVFYCEYMYIMYLPVVA